MKQPKPWYKSRIVWLQFVFGALTAAAGFEPHLRTFLDPSQWFFLSAIINGLTVALRFVTTDPITLRAVRQDEYDGA